jgi:hypothetical protein
MIEYKDTREAREHLNSMYMDAGRMLTKLPVKDRVFDWMDDYMAIRRFIRKVESDYKIPGADVAGSPKQDTPAGDGIKAPSHYQTDGGLECIEVMRQLYGDEAVKTFCKLNAFKYLWRSGKKVGESEAKDLGKALEYLRKFCD